MRPASEDAGGTALKLDARVGVLLISGLQRVETSVGWRRWARANKQ